MDPFNHYLTTTESSKSQSGWNLLKRTLSVLRVTPQVQVPGCKLGTRLLVIAAPADGLTVQGHRQAQH